MRIAVADLGTNSTRLLVADVVDGRVAQLERHTRVTRLGEGVDESGRLAAAATDRVIAALGDYREIATTAGAERTVAVATSAVRDAENGSALIDRARQEVGFDIRTIDGDEEARLTFLGATSKRVDAEAAPVLVIDIGGGSTELVVGRPGEAPTFHVSTRLGSVRHTERHLRHDPPERSELVALATSASATIAAAIPDRLRRDVASAIAVAGTPTSLAAIDQQLHPYDPERVDGYRLDVAACERMLALLAQLPVEKRRKVVGLHPERAPTIVAGVAILVETMRLLGLSDIEVSESDILDGVAINSTEMHP